MPKEDYRAGSRDELGELIDGLDLEDTQKRYLRARWLEQVVWLGQRASQNQRRYYRLRLVTIVGGVIVPALVSLNVQQENFKTPVAWATFSISLVVAISAAVEEFFHYGDRWRTYRQTLERLKGQGWHFFQLSGPYAGFRSHARAYRTFAGDVEALIGQDVDAYVQVVRERRKEPEGEAPAAAES